MGLNKRLVFSINEKFQQGKKVNHEGELEGTNKPYHDTQNCIHHILIIYEDL